MAISSSPSIPDGWRSIVERDREALRENWKVEAVVYNSWPQLGRPFDCEGDPLLSWASNSANFKEDMTAKHGIKSAESTSYVLAQWYEGIKTRQPSHYSSWELRAQADSLKDQPMRTLLQILQKVLLFLSVTMHSRWSLAFCPLWGRAQAVQVLIFISSDVQGGGVVSLPSDGAKHTAYNWAVCQSSLTSVFAPGKSVFLQSIKKAFTLQLLSNKCFFFYM